MSDDLVRVRNRETDEELILGASHLKRWPDDPYDVIDATPEPSASGARGAIPSAYVDDDEPTARP